MKFLHAVLAALLVGMPFSGVAADAGKGSGYDPAANPTQVLDKAMADARATNKKVLVVAGGDWCKWCLILNNFLADNPDVKAELDGSFLTVKAYYAQDNTNTEFFAKLPKAKGYPHFWVISKDGRVTHSIDTGPLENGAGGYDKKEFLRFIREVGKA